MAWSVTKKIYSRPKAYGSGANTRRSHAVIPAIADDRIAGASEILFGGAGDRRIERGENEVAVERGVETFDDEIASHFGNGCAEVPANGLGVGFAGGTLGSGDFGEFEPGVTGEQAYETLTDDSRRAQNAGPQLFLRTPCRRACVFYAHLGRIR